ncbi:hypothetical protein MASR1M48_16750 [Lactococcus petauri]
MPFAKNEVKSVYKCKCGALFAVIFLNSEPFYSNASFESAYYYNLSVRRVRQGLSILFDTSKFVRDNKPVAPISKRATDGSLASLGALF